MAQERDAMFSFPHTDCAGPRMCYTKGLSRRQFIALLTRLGEEFGGGHVFMPEPISEGGIVFRDWNGGDNAVDFHGKRPGFVGMYKSMRLWLGSGGNSACWPEIDSSTVLAEWAQSDTELIPVGSKLPTFLKALGGAPVWTKAELDAVKKCMSEFDVKCTKMPTTKSLVTAAR